MGQDLELEHSHRMKKGLDQRGWHEEGVEKMMKGLESRGCHGRFLRDMKMG
jgi:hypothetical protein